jgi:hypothetical protein
MKQVKLLVMKLLGIMTRLIAEITSSKMVFANDLPIHVKLFVQKHFPFQAISFVEHKETEYEIYLNDGTEVNFTEKGIWKNIDCKQQAVPASLLPEKVVALVKSLFDDALIVKVGKNTKGYEVTLSNAICLRTV